jgi:formate dehydrogenase major subunit
MRLTVDGRPVSVPEGASVLDAVRAAGSWVPTLCHDDRLSPAGECRLCLVRVGAATAAACSTPAGEDMVVTTSDPDLAQDARDVLRMTVARLPRDAAERPGELADLCSRLDVGAECFGTATRAVADRVRDESHAYLAFDPALCVACGRCVRACAEIQGTFALSLTGRGAATVLAPGAGSWAESDCVSCGTCVDTCPTGAISVPVADAARARSPGSDLTTRTTCGYCGVGCTLDVHTSAGPEGAPEILEITPAAAGPVNRGHACVKGRFAHGFTVSPDRLTRPLLRRDGELTPVSWQEALAHLAERVQRIRSESGPDALAVISSSRATNEENYLVQKLVRAVLGTNNVDNCARVCHAPSAAGLAATFGLAGGTNPVEDLDAADLVLVAGANPTEAHPVVGSRIVQAALRGAGLVVVDPRRTTLARLADVHLRGRPGSNVAVFNGLARLLLDRGWADTAFLAARAHGLEELRAVLETYDAATVERLSGVPVADLQSAADLYGAAASPSIVYGLGVTEHAHGTDGVRTLANLAVLRGAVGRPGVGGVNPLRGQNNVQGASDMGALPDLLPGYQKVVDPEVRRRFAARWGVKPPAHPGLRIPDMLQGARVGAVRALWVIGEDIAQTDPDSERVRAALQRCELVVCHDLFLSETARYADLVLPAASFLEKDGTFVNLDRRFQRVRAALAPPGEALSDFDIVRRCAQALGADLGLDTPADAMDECAGLAPLFAGISHARLDREGAVPWPCRSPENPGEARLYLDGFATPSGRAELAARDWRPPGEAPDSEFPFVLVTGRRLEHYNTGTMTRRTANRELLPTETLDMHPDDADRLGLTEGAAAEVSSHRGTVTMPVRRTTDVAPGELFLGFHFPATPTNLLTSSVGDEVTSCPEYKVTAVAVRPAGPEGPPPRPAGPAPPG